MIPERALVVAGLAVGSSVSNRFAAAQAAAAAAATALRAGVPAPLNPALVRIERRQRAKLAIDEAMKGLSAVALEAALREGLDAGLPDELLQFGVLRLGELEEKNNDKQQRQQQQRQQPPERLPPPQQQQQPLQPQPPPPQPPELSEESQHRVAAAAAQHVPGITGAPSLGRRKSRDRAAPAMSPAAARSLPVPVPMPMPRRQPAAANAKGQQPPPPSAPPVLRDGSLVKLHGLKAGVSLSGLNTLNLEKYNGRMGRVCEDAPPYGLIKASGGPAESLVSILLDSRSTDFGRNNGCWIAVPPSHLKVIN